MRSPNALQSCLRNSVSPAASTTKAISSSGAASSRSIECHSMGLPCSSEYCFGPAIPKRLPDPAAGTSPKYREVIECLWNSSDATRYNYTEPPEFERRLRRAIRVLPFVCDERRHSPGSATKRGRRSPPRVERRARVRAPRAGAAPGGRSLRARHRGAAAERGDRLVRAAARGAAPARLGDPALRPFLSPPRPGVGAPGDAVPDHARGLRRRPRARDDRPCAPRAAILPRRPQLLRQGWRSARPRGAALPARPGRVQPRHEVERFASLDEE